VDVLVLGLVMLCSGFVACVLEAVLLLLAGDDVEMPVEVDAAAAGVVVAEAKMASSGAIVALVVEVVATAPSMGSIEIWLKVTDCEQTSG
jgi:hypothetical protein